MIDSIKGGLLKGCPYILWVKDMNEQWKTVEGYPNYEVSNYGNVRNTNTMKKLLPLERKGYFYVDLYNENHISKHCPIHRLVAIAFLGKKDNLVVNHIDGNRYNNKVSNLEWVTPEINSTLASRNGLYKTRRIKINETGKEFLSIKECAMYLKCHPSDISHVLSGKKESYKGYTFSFVENEINKSISFLDNYQIEAVKKMKNGCILNGNVGSGKSRTALYYYFTKNGGEIGQGYYKPMPNPKDLYIITTAKKRDTNDWEKELIYFCMSSNKLYNNKIIIDSWNNIKKYKDVYDSFFIFDEDRVTGSGAWVKAFLKITRKNEWVILSATAGDTWSDYIPVFIANGFYKNKTDFAEQHIVYNRFAKYPLIDKYINTNILLKHRRDILVPMKDQRHTNRIDIRCSVNYDKEKYKRVWRDRWDIYEDRPIEETGKLFYLLRRVVNSDESRIEELGKLIKRHPRTIIFYNFTYELELMRYWLEQWEMPFAEWNGQKHEEVPDGDSWCYLVQYTAGAEGWNCITTDTIIFFSQTYSYKSRQQAAGRIDRINTPYDILYYYHLISYAPIDLAIQKSLNSKKNFNERIFMSANPV